MQLSPRLAALTPAIHTTRGVLDETEIPASNACSFTKGRQRKKLAQRWLWPQEPGSGGGGGKARGAPLKPRGSRASQRKNPGRNGGIGWRPGGCDRRRHKARERKENVEGEAKAGVDRAKGHRRGESGLRNLRREGQSDRGGRGRKDKVQAKVCIARGMEKPCGRNTETAAKRRPEG